MSIAIEADMTHTITPEELLARPDGDRYELVDGRLVGLNVSLKSSWIAGQVLRILGKYLDETPIGLVFPEGTGYRCFPHDPLRVRKPDVSLIRHERITADDLDDVFCAVAPDLVVEVISPHDIVQEVSSKRDDYFSAGVPLIWVIEPNCQTVTVYRRGGESISLLHVTDELSGEEILPGFRCRVADIFPRTEPAVPQASGQVIPE